MFISKQTNSVVEYYKLKKKQQQQHSEYIKRKSSKPIKFNSRTIMISMCDGVLSVPNCNNNNNIDNMIKLNKCF